MSLLVGLLLAGCSAPPGPPNDGGLTVCVGDPTSPSIGAAIATAADGAIIYVCSGVYAERLTISGKQLDLIGIDGADATVIDGGGSGPVITIEGGADVTLSGITFQNGVAPEGGALLCDRSRVQITGSAFRNSRATEYGGGVALLDCTGALVGNLMRDNEAGKRGGGLYHQSDASVTGNMIVGNRAGWTGGGVHVVGHQPTFDVNTIAENSAVNDGGGIYFHQSNGAVLRANHIHHNHCDDDGGGVRIFETAMTVEANLVEDNTTGDGGGGIRVSHVPSIFIANTIRNNDAGGTGGGIDMDNDASTVMGGEISGNHASGSGGGIFHWLGPWNGAVLAGVKITNNRAYRGGGIFLDDNFQTVTMIGLVVAGNQASKGGGLMVRGTSYTIRNSVFIDNKGDRGGAIYAGVNSAHSAWTEPCPPCPPTEPVGRIDFSTFHGNRADDGAALWIDTARVTFASSIVSSSQGAAVSVVPAAGMGNQLTPPRWIYNDTVPASFAGMTDPTGRDGNLSTPPLYIDPNAADFHLKAGSACIDAGDPAMRDPDGSRADMGSFGGPQ